MPARNVRIEVPELRQITLPAMLMPNGETICNMLLMLSREIPATLPTLAVYAPILRETAKLLEALRMGFMAEDADDYDRESMSDGEIAITRGQQTIAKKLDVIITLMEKEAESKKLDRTMG